MSVYGKFTVAISDDTRYVTGQTYDLVLSTVQTPDPSTVITAADTTSPPAPAEVPSEPAS